MSLPDWIQPPGPGMPDPFVIYYDDQKTLVKSLVYLDHLAKRHHSSAPARIMWHINGFKASEGWYDHGLLDRDGGPAYTEWDTAGDLWLEVWHQEGKKHREDGPAKIHYTSGLVREEKWFFQDKLHNSNGPAIVTYHSNGAVARHMFYTHGSFEKEMFWDVSGNFQEVYHAS